MMAQSWQNIKASKSSVKFKKFKIMRSICITLLSLFISISVFSQITADTTYTNQWNTKAKAWEQFHRTITSYNNGLIFFELIQVYEDSKWTNYNYKTHYYNNGQLIEEFEQYWNNLQLKWEDNYRKLYSYNHIGNLVKITHQNIYNGTYFNSTREIMTYYPDGKLKEKVVQKFDEVWTNFLKYQYYYNSSDLLIEENLAYWNENSWDNASFDFRYTYDEKGNFAEKVKTKITGSKKKNITKEEFNYGDNGRLEEHLISVWNSWKNTWINKDRALYVNSLNGYVVSMLSQNTKRKEWINYYFTEFSGKKEAVTGIELADNMAFSVYPTGFGNKATVEFTNPYSELYYIRIVNEEGQLIGSATTKNDEISIAAVNMNKGLYFVELQGSNLYSGKFSIE